MRKILQLILIAILVFVSGHIFISNVEHMIYLNTKTYTYDFQNNASIKNIKTSIQNIKSYMTKIDKLKNSYLSDEELGAIRETINENLEAAEKLPFLTYDSTKNIMNETEFYEVIKSTEYYGISGLVNAYRTIAKYNDNLDIDNFTQTALMQLVYPDFIIRDIIENYKYPTSNDYNMSVEIRPLALINSIAVRLNCIECISKIVSESGEINE